MWLPVPASGNLSDRRISAGIAFHGQIRGVSNQRILYRSGLWAGGLLLCLSLLAGYAGSLLTDQTKGWNEWLYQNVQKKTSQISRALESQNGLFGNHNPTADGSLNNYPVEQKDEIDLTVRTSGKPAHNMYLRGFTGGVYQGNSWSAVNRNDFADAFSEADSDGRYRISCTATSVPGLRKKKEP